MDFKTLVYQNRSYRRFVQSHKIELSTLRELVDFARMTPSGKNKQWLKYLLLHEKEDCDFLCESLGWAAFLKDWSGPSDGERPTGYIVILKDTDLTGGEEADVFIAAQTILLGSVAQGLGGCMFLNIHKKRITERFAIPSHLQIAMVVALGRPAEQVVVEPIPADGDVRYYRTGNVHHVPKRTLEEVIFTPKSK